MSEEEIKEQIKIWGDTKDMFDPNNPEHIELTAMILMKCVYCGYEEEAETEIVVEIMDMESGEYPEIMCPECSSKRKTSTLGYMVPKDIYISDFKKP